MVKRALQLNASASEGGAARAAVRVHQGLLAEGPAFGWTSRSQAASGAASGPGVCVRSPFQRSAIWRRLHPRLVQWRKRQWRTNNPALHSLAWPDTGLGAELIEAHSRGDFELLNLHWLGDSTLSIEEIGRLQFPVLWALHGQWPFSGAEHYAPLPASGADLAVMERFTSVYERQTTPALERKCDLNLWTWQRKKRCWRQPMTLICPSQWMADCVQRSALMRDWPCHVIPNPLNLQQWTPVEPRLARRLLDLPLEGPLVLFGAMGGTADLRKGSDLLEQALVSLAECSEGQPRQPQLVIFGQATSALQQSLGLPVHCLGHLYDSVSLCLAYSAADVMVVTSRLDNLPNTATEAMACGTPVVAFRTGGLPEIVNDGISGWLADAFEPEDLAKCIAAVIANPDKQRAMAHKARQQAEARWHPKGIAARYAEVYDEALERFQ